MPACLRVPLLLLAAAVCGCGPKPIPSVASTPTSVGLKAPEDRSLSVEEYAQLGLPGVDHTWTTDERTKAVQVLTDLAKKNPAQLPRYNSNRSGAVFARLLAREVVEQLRDARLPPPTRSAMAISYFDFLEGIHKAYLAAFQDRLIGGSEKVEFVIHFSHLWAYEVETFQLLMREVSTDHPKFGELKVGMTQLKLRLATDLHPAYEGIADTKMVAVEDRSRLVDAGQKTLPVIVSYLMPENQKEVLRKLDDMNGDPKLSDLQPALGKLRDAVKKAVADAK